MPIEIGIVYENNMDQIELIEIKTKSNYFVITLDQEPKNVILDPNYWVLMNKDFERKSPRSTLTSVQSCELQEASNNLGVSFCAQRMLTV